MDGGFIFDGIDIADLGLEYAPDLSNTYIYKPGTFKLHEQIFDAHDGGYFYGTTTQPKDFTLRCFYESQHVLDGLMTKIFSVFRRGRTGRLVFKKRPWCWYTATVTNVDIGQMFNFENGVLTVTMKAYYPYARSDYLDIPNNCEYEADMLNNSAMLREGVIDHTNSFITEPTTELKEFLVYNPGTEYAKTTIRISGNFEGNVKVTNSTTDQHATFVAFTTQLENGNYYIESDSLNGQTVRTNGSVRSPGYLYHHEGFIDLAPGFPVYRDIRLNVISNTNIQSDHQFTPDMLGRYVYFNNGVSAEIKNVMDDSHIQVNKTVGHEADGPAQIMLMNKIIVKPTNSTVTRFEVLFKPTYA